MGVWEWTSDPMEMQRGAQGFKEEDELWTLKGGSFVDSIDGAFNHKATVVTRMGNTADSGSYNTGFRCAHGVGGGGRKPPMDQAQLSKIVEEGGVEALQEFLKEQGQGAQVMTPQQLKEQQAKVQ